MILEDFTKYAKAGVLGHFGFFEVTEIFALKDKARPMNVFTIIVGQEEGACSPPHFLTKGLIQIKSLKGWRVGIQRSVLSKDEMTKVLERWEGCQNWQVGVEPIQTGKLGYSAPQFVPADGYAPKHWNRMLKNNFWNGSYIFELANAAKLELSPLYTKPSTIQDLSELILQYVPIHLAGLSDRLGNVVIQLPITTVTSELKKKSTGLPLQFQNIWKNSVDARPLCVSVDAYFDGVVQAHFSALVGADYTTIPLSDHEGGHRWWLWDDINGLLLGASSESSYVNSISTAMHINSEQTRDFTIPGDDGVEEIKVNVKHLPEVTSVGRPHVAVNGKHTSFRMYQEERMEAAKSLRFVQYGGDGTQKADEAKRALTDIRTLITRHGSTGAWLWDPYLSGIDLLKTLFFAPTANAELRGLTSRAQISETGKCDSDEKKPVIAKSEWVRTQKELLQQNCGTTDSLNLTFRLSSGRKSFPFHDRFLIFPQTNQGALAWSLGTSVNALGQQHHILQQVSDGQLIVDAFNSLWSALVDPANLIWKSQ
jgi:hypothetical protein